MQGPPNLLLDEKTGVGAAGAPAAGVACDAGGAAVTGLLVLPERRWPPTAGPPMSLLFEQGAANLDPARDAAPPAVLAGLGWPWVCSALVCCGGVLVVAVVVMETRDAPERGRRPQSPPDGPG